MRSSTSAVPDLVRGGARPLAAMLIAGMAVGLAPGGVSTRAEAKTPGRTYCFNRTCHRVKTLAETRALIGKTVVLHASFYDDAKRDRYNPSNLTSSGAYFRADRADNAASPVLPDGTKVLVWHPGSRKAVVVRINNAGPYYGRRMIDLSRAAAETLGFAHNGVATVHTRVLAAPSAAEATYRRGRTYAPVPGYIGRFGTLEMAMADAAQTLGLPGAATRVAAAPPPDPVRKPSGETTVARLPVAQTGTGGDASMFAVASVDVEVPPMPLRPALLTLADAGERLATAHKSAEQRMALAALDTERRRVALERAAAARRVAQREKAERDKAREQRLAEARAAKAKARVIKVTKASSEEEKEESASVKVTSAAPGPVARPTAVAQAQPVKQPESDMSWVKVALSIN